ncbi:hypothetical protein F4604DRAFT_1164582 [Suillus subluteus]|nr:hypothetical protein F4604DRAFT_1164582 [Suillus subluteus]
MTFVTLGSSMGAIVYSIMLNNLLNGRVGFANGVRASAGLTSVLLLVACLCMRTRLDPPTTPVNYLYESKHYGGIIFSYLYESKHYGGIIFSCRKGRGKERGNYIPI